MNKKINVFVLVLVLSLVLNSFTALALTNSGGGSWANYKDIDVGFKSETYTPDANTILYYPFSDSNTLGTTYTPVDNAEGTSTYDGTVTGALSSEGVIGSGMYFDGVDDIMDFTAIGTTTDISFNLWAKAHTIDGTDNNFLSLAGLFDLKLDSTTGEFALGTYDGSSKWAYGGVADGNWHLFSGVIDDTANTLKFYVDGVLVDSISSLGTIPWSTYTSRGWHLGAANYGSTNTNHANVEIDEFIITDDVWTADEVYDYYTSSVTQYSSYEVSEQVKTIDLQDKTSDLILYLPFDTDEDDESIYLNDLTNNGATITTSDGGYIDEAFDFDGTDDYLNMGSAGDLNPASADFSYSFWLKTTQSSDSYILGKGSAGDNHLINIRKANNELSVGFEGSGDQISTYETTATVNDGTWKHFVVTVDRDTSNMKYYLDGSLDSTHDFSITDVGSIEPSEDLIIGAKYDSAGYFFDGLIDEVKVFNRALEPYEIKAIYDRTTILSDTPYFGSTYEDDLRIVEDDVEIDYAFKDFKDEPISFELNSLTDATGDFAAFGGVSGGFDSTKGFHYVDFDGTDDYLDVSDNIITSDNSAFYISFWTYLDSTTGTTVFIDNHDNSPGEGIVVQVDDGLLDINIDGSSTDYFSIESDSWIHIVINYDGTDMELYKNSVLKNTITTSINANSEFNTVIGDYTHAKSYGIDGKMANVQFGDSALSASDVKELYLGNAVGTPVWESSFDQLTSDTSEQLSLEANGGVKFKDDFTFNADSYIELNDYISNTGATINVWFNPASMTDYDRLFSSTDTANRVYLGINSDKLWYRIGDLADTNADTTLSLDTWQMATLTFDADEAQIYLNGATDDTAQSFTFSDPTGNFYIAQALNGINRFDGSMRDVQVFDKMLSSTEISNLYASESVAESNLVYEWNPTNYFDFDGTNDYLDLASDLNLYEETSFSWCAWYNYVDESVQRDILSLRDGIALVIDNSNNLRMDFKSESSDWAGAVTLSTTANDWHLGCVTFDSGTAYIYNDATQSSATTDTDTTLYNGVYTLLIGRDNLVNTNGIFEGQIKGVQLYDRALTSTEVTTLYNSGTYAAQSWKSVSSTPTRATFKISTDSTETSNNYAFKDYQAFYNNPSATAYTQTNILDTFANPFKEITYYLLGTEQSSNAAPIFGKFNVTNIAPIDTTESLDVLFNVTDDDNDNLNISITWFKSIDGGFNYLPHNTDDESWLNQAFSTYDGTDYNTGITGDLESSDTAGHEYWIPQGTVTDGFSSNSINGSAIYIINTIPEINSVNIIPSNPLSTDRLISVCDASDDDGDSLTTEYSWYVNGDVYSDSDWIFDSNIKNGLTFGGRSGQDSFYYEGEVYLTMGQWDGSTYIYYWDDSNDIWVRDSSFENGVSSSNECTGSKLTVFMQSGTLSSITTGFSGTGDVPCVIGKSWDDSSWNVDSSVITGLSSATLYNFADSYTYNGELRLFYSNKEWRWNETTSSWSEISSSSGYHPSIFIDTDGMLKKFNGDDRSYEVNVLTGYVWDYVNDNAWIRNSSMDIDLSSGLNSGATLFYQDNNGVNTSQLIVGSNGATPTYSLVNNRNSRFLENYFDSGDEVILQCSVYDGFDTVNLNSSTISINTAPVVTASSSSTTNENPVNSGEDITFTISSTDIDSSNIQLKICSSYTLNWDECNVMCSQLTNVSLNPSTPQDISCEYTSSDESSRENTAYALIYDGDTTNTNITYFVNQPAVVENYSIQDVGGGVTFYFGEYIDFFSVDVSDDITFTGTPVIRVTDGSYAGGSRLIDDATMALDVSNTYKYDTDTYIDAIGNFYVYIKTTDDDGAITWLNTTFEALSFNVETGGRIYAYDTQELSTNAEITSLIDTYDYYAVELRINKDSDWTTVSNTIQSVKDNSELVILTYEVSDMDLASADTTYINSHYADLIDSDHLNGIRQLKIIVSDSDGAKVAPDSISSLLNLNEDVAKPMFQQTQNKFPIYVRNLGSGYDVAESGLSYASFDEYIYISNTTKTNYIDAEMSYLKSSTDKSRIYYSLSDELKTSTASFQSNVINKMRSNINESSSYSDSNVAELVNGDLIVANNQSSSQEFIISTIGVDKSHAYDLTNKEIISNDPSSSITLDVPQYDFSMIYFSNLTKIIVEDDDDVFLYGSQPRTFETSVDLTAGSSNAFLFTSSSTNPEDGRIMLTDPSYEDAGFVVWYGTHDYEAIADFERYSLIVVGDSTDATWLNARIAETNVFGYTSVNNYGNNNLPVGCTAGVDCTSWDRATWISDKQDEIDVWTNINVDLNIFIDGLDIGAVNDVDGLFGDSLVSLADYVKVSKQRELILNTYTNYEDYANLGDYTMRESACGRWDGSVNSPTYSYESIATEIQRANFHQSHGIPVLAQVFGDITDYEKANYCFMQTKVLYGDLAEVSYNQPLFDYTGATDNFQWNYFKYPDLGVALEDDYTQVGDDSYKRRFENGIVQVNTTNHEVTYTTNDVVDSMSLCAYFYDNDDGVDDEGYLHIVFNDNMSQYVDISDDDLTAFVKTLKCVDVPLDYYQPSGFYELEFYYLDSDGTYTGNTGMYMYHSSLAGEDRLSQYDSVLNDHPSNDESNYVNFATGDNWAMSFEIDRSVSESAIDDISAEINRSTSGVEKLTVTIDSLKDWDVNIYDRTQSLNKDVFNGIFVNNTLLNSNGSNCETNNPTYNVTLVDGENWSACHYESESIQYVKVVAPSLSERTYVIDGNTHPNISVETYVLDNLNNNNQSWSLNFTFEDADSNNITTCGININGVNTTSTPSNNICNFTINKNLSSYEHNITPFVIDEYDDASSDGVLSTLATIVYDGIASDNQTGNFSVQYFRKYWNISQTIGNYSNVLFDYEDLIPRSINLSSGITKDYLIYTTDLISNDIYYLVPDASDAYTVDAAETVFSYFNVTGNLSTGENIPEFNVSIPTVLYTNGVQAIYSGCGTYDSAYNNFESGESFVTSINGVSNDSTSCFNYSFASTPVYSDASLALSTDGNEGTYYFENEENNSYGAKVNFYFDELKDNPIDLTYTFEYSALSNWESRDTSSKQIYRFNEPSTFTQESITTDYTFEDIELSEIVQFNWPLTNAPLDNLYVNLSYTTTIAIYQCNDGLDNDGDGNIDFPADSDCSSLTDNSESSATTGGGGGSSPSPTIDVSCKVSFDPEFVKFASNGVRQIEIFNTGSTTYNPSIKFSGDIASLLSVTNTVSIPPGKSADFGIEYFSSEFVEGDATLILTDSSCGSNEIVVRASQVIAASDIIGELFEQDEDENAIENVVNFFTEPAFSEAQPNLRSQTPLFSVGIVFLLMATFAVFLLSKPITVNWRQQVYGKSSIFITVALAIGFILTLFAIVLIRSIGV